MNESCHVWVSDIICEWVIWMVSHMNGSCHPYEWVHDSFTYRDSSMHYMVPSYITHSCVTCLIHIRHDSLIHRARACVTKLIHTWRDSFIRDITHSVWCLQSHLDQVGLFWEKRAVFVGFFWIDFFGQHRGHFCRHFSEWDLIFVFCACRLVGNEACRTGISHVAYEWGMSHMSRIHASNMNGSCHIRMTHVDESCHMWTSHVTYGWVMCHKNMSRHTYEWHEWAMSHINHSYEWAMTHMNDSHEWVMSHMNPPYERVTSHINASRHVSIRHGKYE